MISAADRLTTVIQRTIEVVVPITKPFTFAKRWWCKELTTLRTEKNQLLNRAYMYRHVPEHPVHMSLLEAQREYATHIQDEKDEHWESWLEDVNNESIWTAGHYVTNP